MSYAKPNPKFKLTAAIEKDLTALAKSLPYAIRCESNGSPILVRREYYGHELIAKGESAADGSKINPRRIYIKHETVPVDHKDNILFHYKKSGMVGVDQYMDVVHEFEKRRQQRILRGKKWYVQLYIKFVDLFKGYTLRFTD